MAERIPVTDIDIALDHRIRDLPGSPTNAIPALRIGLANCAALRKQRTGAYQPTLDGKRLAAGDID
jgi:hypothetical protein